VRQLCDLLFLRIVRRVASERGSVTAYSDREETARQRHLAQSMLARHNSIRALMNDRLLFNDAERFVSGNLAKITAPSIIVQGDHDPTVPARNGRRLAEGLPLSTYEEIEADHQLPAKNTEYVADAARRVLALDL
jgi:pimeloyl-ACP methyl ester carboxylesterase